MEPWIDPDVGPSTPIAVFVKLAAFTANTILAAETASEPSARVIVEDRIVGRKAGGNIGALTAAEVRTILNVSPEMEYATKNSSTDAGTIGGRAYDDDYEYTCTKTGTAGNAIWKKSPMLNT